MNYTPYTSEKDLPNILLEKGTYDVEVIEAIEAVSQRTGVDMIRLNVAVWVGDKVRTRIFDYLLDAIPAKLRHACDTFGLLAKYEARTLQASDFEGRTGKARIGIQTDEGGNYPDKNVIQDYVCRTMNVVSKEQQPAMPPPPAPADDDLPF